MYTMSALYRIINLNESTQWLRPSNIKQEHMEKGVTHMLCEEADVTGCVVLTSRLFLH